MASWIGAGRRPLVQANDYTRELVELAPGAATLYDDDDGLRRAVAAALADPALDPARPTATVVVAPLHRRPPRRALPPGGTVTRPGSGVVRLGHGSVVPGNRWDLARDGVVAARSGPLPSIAVIVTHFRQEAQLQLVYAALADQRVDCADLEVIVVDDGSPQLPPPPPPPLSGRVVRQPDLGIRPAAARNLGARSTPAEILVFLDGDTVPEPDYVATMAAWPAVVPDALVVGRRGHADLGALGPEAAQRFVASGGRVGSEVRLPPPTWLEDGYRQTGDLLRVDRRSYRFVISAVVACHRRLFDDIGGFDASIRRYGSEDWDVAYRAHNNGGVLVHEPDAVAWHDGPRWEERSGDQRARNDEAMRLAGRIPVPGSRAPGVVHGRPDVIVEVRLGPDVEVATAVADGGVDPGGPARRARLRR